MRISPFRLLAALAVGLVFCFGANAWAGHVRHSHAVVSHVHVRVGHVRHSKVVVTSAAVGDLLSQAYFTLGSADHDYKGHRIAAMRQIEAAGKSLGVNVHGDGKVREAQAVSDQQLRTAQGLLEQARTGLAGKPLKHVNQAIHHLSTALSIR